MISETITIPKTISDQEDRFVVKLKDNLLRMIKEINKNGKKIDEINTEHKDPDYTDIFNSKANVDASNIGYGDQFIEKKDDEGEVVYSADDNREDWGLALTNSKNTIAEDNVTLVSSQNVYDETHPYMDKDGEGGWINPYNYINYKNLTEHEGAEDINKQDRWSEQDFFQPHEPNDNKVKENLIALDTAIYEVAQQLDDKANISLDNINQQGGLVINTIARGSIFVTDEGENALVRVRKLEPIYDQEYGLYTDVYQVYTDYEPEPSGITLARLYKETRRFISGLEQSPNKHYDKDSNNDPSYIDSGYDTVGYRNDYDPNITVARNVSNLNDGLISLIEEFRSFRKQFFGNSKYYFLGDPGSSYDWTLQWNDNEDAERQEDIVCVQPENAYFEFEENQTTHEKDLILHRETWDIDGVKTDSPTDDGQTVYFGTLKFSSKINLIENLLDECETKKNEIEKLCKDIYMLNPATPPNNRYSYYAYDDRWFVQGQGVSPGDPDEVATDLCSDVYNINDLIYDKSYGILYKIDDLLSTVNDIVDAINNSIIPAITSLDQRVSALEGNSGNQSTISNFSGTSSSEYNPPSSP